MSFLQRARDKAAEVAKEAADATTRAAGTVAAKAQDPATQERVKTGLATAGRTTGAVAGEAAHASAKAAGAVAAKAQDPATQARVRDGLASAGRGARTVVERIDPGILAEVIIKATALQEKANARLRTKGSIYRIGEIQVTASLPPGISFSIERIGDADHDGLPDVEVRSSTELVAEEATARAEAIVSLDTHEQAAIEEEIADVGAAMDGVVEALPPSNGSPGGPDGGPLAAVNAFEPSVGAEGDEAGAAGTASASGPSSR